MHGRALRLKSAVAASHSLCIRINDHTQPYLLVSCYAGGGSWGSAIPHLPEGTVHCAAICPLCVLQKRVKPAVHLVHFGHIPWTFMYKLETIVSAVIYTCRFCIRVSPHPLPGCPVVKRILAMMQILNLVLLRTAQGAIVFTRINHGSKES